MAVLGGVWLTQTEGKKGLCHWCGSEVGDRVWKDGNRVYCSTDCHSAGLLPVFVLVVCIFTPFFVVELMFSGIISMAILEHYSALPIFAYGFFVVAVIVYFISIYFGYQGWKARKEIIRRRDT